MRARYINEKFTQDSDPVQDMGIGTRAQIKKWFDSAKVSSKKYLIDDDLHVIVGGNLYLQYSAITELPDNLSIGGWLNLQDSKITELPDNLSVGGDLNLQGTAITELPDNLKVKGKIYKDF